MIENQKKIFMEQILSEIKDGFYGNDLNLHMLELKNRFKSSDEINMLFYLTKINPNEISSNCILDKEPKLLSNSEFLNFSRNKEISAKWKDYLFHKVKENKVNNIREAFSLYKEIFEISNDYSYLLRTLRIVKIAKNLFSLELDTIYEYSKNIVFNCNIPFQQSQIISEMYSLKPEKTKLDLGQFIKAEIKIHFNNNNYDSVRLFIKSLKEIGIINFNQYKIYRAKSYESEGDYNGKNREINTYYPKILELYLIGLKEFKNITTHVKHKNRIEQKVKKEQKEYIKMLKVCGIKSDIDYDVIIDQYIIDSKINNFISGYQSLISLPIFNIADIGNNNKKETFFSSFFNDYRRVNDKGSVVGISNEEIFFNSLDRSYYRDFIISLIKRIKNIMDADKAIDKNLIYSFLFKHNSKFIPKARVYLYAEGIYAGFCNNYILSAHLLIPQIENSLKSIIELNGKSVTRLSEEKQIDNTLGALLNADDKGERMLKGICEENLLEELSDFLTNANSVNFRNELCHGLLEPFLIEYYGMYLWWLCLKIIDKTETYFLLPIKNY